MGDSNDDMEAYSGFMDVDSDEFDNMVKIKMAIEYCEPHLDKMWAARISGILLGCDFRDCKQYIDAFYEHCEEEGL